LRDVLACALRTPRCRSVVQDPVADRDKANHTVPRFGNEAMDSWGACPALGSVAQISKAIL
jgi:hypothetical protein